MSLAPTKEIQQIDTQSQENFEVVIIFGKIMNTYFQHYTVKTVPNLFCISETI